MAVLIIVLGLICAASALPRNPRIVGGEATTIEKYPFMAGLSEEWNGVFYFGCGGTLVSTTAVVSAAHCYDYFNTKPTDNSCIPVSIARGQIDRHAVATSLRVRLGTNMVSSGGTDHTVSRLILHPEYNGDLLLNDILVLRLRDPAVYSKQINAARIAGPRYILPDNTVVYAAGWGNIQYGGPHSPILQHVAVDVINHKICTERHAYLKTQPDMEYWPDVTSEMLCTGILDVGGKDACHGDSGGPVIHNGDVLVGVTSFGYECAHPNYPGVNVRVSSYTDWIYRNSVN